LVGSLTGLAGGLIRSFPSGSLLCGQLGRESVPIAPVSVGAFASDSASIILNPVRRRFIATPFTWAFDLLARLWQSPCVAASLFFGSSVGPRLDRSSRRFCAGS
jgi:hypothetical protein